MSAVPHIGRLSSSKKIRRYRWSMNGCFEKQLRQAFATAFKPDQVWAGAGAGNHHKAYKLSTIKRLRKRIGDPTTMKEGGSKGVGGGEGGGRGTGRPLPHSSGPPPGRRRHCVSAPPTAARQPAVCCPCRCTHYVAVGSCEGRLSLSSNDSMVDWKDSPHNSCYEVCTVAGAIKNKSAIACAVTTYTKTDAVYRSRTLRCQFCRVVIYALNRCSLCAGLGRGRRAGVELIGVDRAGEH